MKSPNPLITNGHENLWVDKDLPPAHMMNEINNAKMSNALNDPDNTLACTVTTSATT